MMRVHAFSAAIAVTSLVGCNPPSTTTLRMWSTGDLIASAKNGGATLPIFQPSEIVTPAGGAIHWLSEPYSGADVAQTPTNDGLNVIPAFSEGATAGIVVVDIWEGYHGAVWVQPIYLFIGEWEPANPGSSANRLPMSPVIGVGEKSTFYSPFWQNYWVVVPPDQRSNSFDSVKVIDDDSELQVFGGNANFCPLTPSGVLFSAAADGANAQRPLSGESISQPSPGTGVLDGRQERYLRFGTDRFTWNAATNLVNEVNLYVFAKLDANGKPTSIGLPPVIGTGGSPIFMNVPPPCTPSPTASCAKPSFGALADVNWVFLPPTAGAFVPAASYPALAQQTSLNVPVPPVDPQIPPDVANQYLLRVATNASTCFGTAATFPAACNWLDSEAAIQSVVDGNSLQDSTVYVALGIPFFGGKTVP
jgi:hypothetical protein